MSLPSRGVWIEIPLCVFGRVSFASLPSRGVWIEIFPKIIMKFTTRSLPSRGVWIEIDSGQSFHPESAVAPLAGSVD